MWVKPDNILDWAERLRIGRASELDIAGDAMWTPPIRYTAARVT
jgi:hypothetical protein